jgi:hypothetical protein
VSREGPAQANPSTFSHPSCSSTTSSTHTQEPDNGPWISVAFSNGRRRYLLVKDVRCVHSCVTKSTCKGLRLFCPIHVNLALSTRFSKWRLRFNILPLRRIKWTVMSITSILHWFYFNFRLTVSARNMGTVSNSVSYILRFLQAVLRIIRLNVVRSIAHRDP